MVGTARSGSTILGSVLNQVNGWFAAGEVRHLWDRGLDPEKHCACGEVVQCCSVWRRVLQDGMGRELAGVAADYRGGDEPFWGARPADVLRIQDAITRFYALRRLPVPKGEQLRYANVLGGVYQSLANAVQADVLVDASKEVSDAGALLSSDALNGSVYLLHLVRDPRAVAFSSMRRPYGSRVTTAGLRPLSSVAASWLRINAAAELLCARWPRGMMRRLRYEDFARDPQGITAGLVEWVTGKPLGRTIVNQGRLVSSSNHQISGGRVRTKKADVEITLDTAWKTGLSKIEQATISALSIPLMVRYGYPATGAA